MNRVTRVISSFALDFVRDTFFSFFTFSYLRQGIGWFRSSKISFKTRYGFFFPDQRSSILNFVNRRCNNANAVAQAPLNAKFILANVETNEISINLAAIYSSPLSFSFFKRHSHLKYLEIDISSCMKF